MAIINHEDLLDIQTFLPGITATHATTNPSPLEFVMVHNVRLETVEPGKVTILWNIKDTALDVNSFTFFIQRSGSESGPFTEVSNGGLTNTFEFDDNHSPGLAKFWEVYYRLLVVSNATGKFYVTDVATFYEKPDIIGREIARRNKLLLDRFIGTSCKFYKRRHWGARCGTCWDPVLRRVTRSNCTTCFNTGYEYGYWDPIDIKMNFNPTQNMIEHTPWGMTEPSGVVAWTARRPLIEPMDLIHEITRNRRWIVLNKSGTEKLRTQIRQILQLEELEKSRAEFKIIEGAE